MVKPRIDILKENLKKKFKRGGKMKAEEIIEKFKREKDKSPSADLSDPKVCMTLAEKIHQVLTPKMEARDASRNRKISP